MATLPNLVGVEVALWFTAGAATILTFGRFAIRYAVRKSFYWDDFAHLMAWMCMIGMSAVFQDTFRSASLVVTSASPPADAVISFRKHQVALTLLLLLTLWFVKYAFLFFYKLLFWVSPTFKSAWWTVAVLLFCTFWIPVAGVLTDCGPVSHSFDPAACQAKVRDQQIILEYVCAISVFTDLIVIALPWYMIRKVKIRTSQKIGLTIILSVAFVTVVLDILRTYESYTNGAFSNSAIYSFLEAQFAVIVSCLPTYRAVFGIERRIKGPEYLDLGLPRTSNNSEGQSLTKGGSAEATGRRNSFTKYGVEGLEDPVHDGFQKHNIGVTSGGRSPRDLELQELPQAHTVEPR